MPPPLYQSQTMFACLLQAAMPNRRGLVTTRNHGQGGLCKREIHHALVDSLHADICHSKKRCADREPIAPPQLFSRQDAWRVCRARSLRLSL